MPKQSKQKVNYTDNHGTSNEQCSKCKHYLKVNVNIGACVVVSGQINPNGWCKMFARKKIQLRKMVA